MLACVVSHQALAIDLLESYRLALAQDATFLAVRSESEATREVLPQARAQLLPTVSINGTLSQSDTATRTMRADVFGDLKPYEQDYQYTGSSFGLIVKQPVYRKALWAQYDQAKAQVTGADASEEQARLDVVNRVSGAYFDALFASDTYESIRLQKNAYSEQLKAAKRAFDSGRGTLTDIDEAQARYDMVLASELESLQNIDYTRQQLGSLINRSVDRLAILALQRFDPAAPTPAKLDDWLASAEQNNPDLRLYRLQIDMAAQEVEKARAGNYPTVDAYAQYQRQDSDSTTTINTQNTTTQVGIQLAIPLYAGGYVSSSLRAATSNLEKVRQRYEAKRRNLSLQVQKAFRDVTEGIAKVKAFDQAYQSAQRAVYSTRRGQEAGTRSSVDVLDALQQEANALRDLAHARYQYLVARIRLASLGGDLNAVELEKVNALLE